MLTSDLGSSKNNKKKHKTSFQIVSRIKQQAHGMKNYRGATSDHVVRDQLSEEVTVRLRPGRGNSRPGNSKSKGSEAGGGGQER